MNMLTTRMLKGGTSVSAIRMVDHVTPQPRLSITSISRAVAADVTSLGLVSAGIAMVVLIPTVLAALTPVWRGR
jgi:hypothetical protein